MKHHLFRFLGTIVCLFTSVLAFAQPVDPPPPDGCTDCGDVPQFPGLPINENLTFMFVVAVIFGTYVIYRYNLKQKTLI